MRVVDYFLSEGAINAIYGDDLQPITSELRSMETGQRCYVIGTSTITDKKQLRIRSYQNKLIKTLGDDSRNYDVKIVLPHDDSIRQWLSVDRLR